MKIVIRDSRGPSGTLNNNELCKQRVAIGLSFAPELLSQLKAKGHTTLAEEIDARAAAAPKPEPQPQAKHEAKPKTEPKPKATIEPESKLKTKDKTAPKPKSKAKAEPRPKPKAKAAPRPNKKANSKTDAVGEWLAKLPGSDAWEACKGIKRAKLWYAVNDTCELKLPVERGKKEWVLKKSSSDAKPKYFAAPDFKGICKSLEGDSLEFFESFLGGCADLANDSDDVRAAIEAWHKR